MAIPIQNVVITTDTFRSWVDTTNKIATAMTNNVLTAESNTVGATTTGNTNLDGILSANTFACKTVLRGGTVDTPNTLVVTGNTNFIDGNIVIESNISVDTVSGSFVIDNCSIGGGDLEITSNTDIVNTGHLHITTPSANVSISSFNTTSDLYVLKGTTSKFESDTLVIDGTNLEIKSDVNVLSNTFNVVSDINIESTKTDVSGTITFNDTMFVSDSVTKNTGIGIKPEHPLDVNVNSYFRKSVNIVGDTTIDNNLTIGGEVSVDGLITFGDDVVFVDTVNDKVGINTKTPTVEFDVIGSSKISSDLGVLGKTTTKDFVSTDTSVFGGSIQSTANTTIVANKFDVSTETDGKVISITEIAKKNSLVVSPTSLSVTANTNTLNVGSTIHYGSVLFGMDYNKKTLELGIDGNSTYNKLLADNTFISGNTEISNDLTVLDSMQVGKLLYVNHTSRSVGIGVINPEHTLDVDGDTNIKGNLFVLQNSTLDTAVIKKTLQSNSADITTVLSTRDLLVSGNTTVEGNVSIVGDQSTINSNLSVANDTTEINSKSINVSGGNMSISSNTVLRGVVTVTNDFNMGTVVSNSVVTNPNLGASIKTEVEVFRFNTFNSYKFAKLLVSATQGTDTQFSELLIAHNGESGSQPTLTTYGTVCAPTGGNVLVDFTVDVVNNDVILYAKQNKAYTSIVLTATKMK